MERPLITFMVITYNQERFIREAMEGAFSQTYSPLEIIISDDSSTDSTFEIIKEMAAAYKGPHKIRINRNENNLGLGGNVNRVMELAQGELIIASAGDDISLPGRTREIFDAWEDSGRSAYSLYSNYIVINENSEGSTVCRQPLGLHANDPFFLLQDCNIIGATHAWHRDVFRIFGPLIEGVWCEDRVIPYRSILLGKIVWIDKTLVKYRRHEQNCSFTKMVKHPILNLHQAGISNLDNLVIHTQSYLQDTETYTPQNKDLLGHIKNRKGTLNLQKLMITSSFGGRLKSLIEASRGPTSASIVFIMALKYLFPIPYNIYCLLRYGKQTKPWDRFISKNVKNEEGV